MQYLLLTGSTRTDQLVERTRADNDTRMRDTRRHLSGREYFKFFGQLRANQLPCADR